MPVFLIAITNPLKLQGLLDIVSGISPHAPNGLARDASSTFRALKQRLPDVLVVDGLIASEVKERLRGEFRLPRTLIVGIRRHVGLCPGGSGNTACGFVGEGAEIEEFASALRQVASCPRASMEPAACASCPLRATLRRPELPLSTREREVFERIARGEGDSTMAQSLGLSVKTVEHYRASIKRKLGLSTAHELVRAAVLWERGEFEAGQ